MSRPSELGTSKTRRRGLLDTARCYGYELVMPRCWSIWNLSLTGTGGAGSATFSWSISCLVAPWVYGPIRRPRWLGIDAHCLIARPSRVSAIAVLCCARPDRPMPPEPLQFCAEIYSHAVLEADLEALRPAQDCLRVANVQPVPVDLWDVRIVSSLLAGERQPAGAEAKFTLPWLPKTR